MYAHAIIHTANELSIHLTKIVQVLLGKHYFKFDWTKFTIQHFLVFHIWEVNKHLHFFELAMQLNHARNVFARPAWVISLWKMEGLLQKFFTASTMVGKTMIWTNEYD